MPLLRVRMLREVRSSRDRSSVDSARGCVTRSSPAESIHRASQGSIRRECLDHFIIFIPETINRVESGFLISSISVITTGRGLTSGWTGNGRLRAGLRCRADCSNLATEGPPTAMNVWLRERLGADGIVVNDGHARHFFEQIAPDSVHLEDARIEERTVDWRDCRPVRVAVSNAARLLDEFRLTPAG